MGRHKRNKRHSKLSSDEKKDDQELIVDTLSHDGRGVGRTKDGKVVFVEGALPNEHVMYEPVDEKKNFSTGIVSDVIKPSQQRVQAKCRIFGKCGGCSIQHLNGEEQIIEKQKQLIDNLNRIGNVSPRNVLSSMTGELWNYRCRARFGTTFAQTKNEIRIGFRAKNSHYVQPTMSCDIIEKEASDLLEPLKLSLNYLADPEKVVGVEISVADNKATVIIQYDGSLQTADNEYLIQFSKENEVQLFVDNTNDAHSDLQLIYPEKKIPLFYRHTAFNIEVEFGPRDFIQVNKKMNERLVTEVVDLLDIQKTDRVLDLFCGVGNFTLPMATKAHYVVGVEGNDTLVHRAMHNKKRNQLKKIDFFYGDLFDERMNEHTHGIWLNQTFDKIVLDPPRSGALEIVRHIKKFNASRIVYVSCDPATLSRDAQILVHEQGYSLTHVMAVDMFPQTSHVESVAVFEHS